jgi:O-antigen/teichoic acid export membrane protein
MVGITAYGTVLNPKLSSILDFKQLLHEIKKAKLISFIMSLLLILGVFMGPIVIRLFFQNKYEGAIIPLKIMLVSLIPYVWCLPFNSALFAIGKSSVFFYGATLGLVINSVSSVLLIPKYGAIGSSISFSTLNLLGLIVALIFFNIYFKEKNIVAQA